MIVQKMKKKRIKAAKIFTISTKEKEKEELSFSNSLIIYKTKMKIALI
jgi:hypothetical protein